MTPGPAARGLAARWLPTVGLPMVGLPTVGLPTVRLPALVLLALVLLAGACTEGDATAGGDTASGGPVHDVAIDGGSETAVATRSVNVSAAPGDTVRITNANGGPEGREAAEHGGAGTVTHALVAVGEGDLPPLFVAGQGGAVANAGVWGSCRGGQAAEALGTCPVPPIDGPSAWDGTGYWSTGAMLPRESREVPLATDIAAGTHRLVCVIHPDLFVDVVVSDEPAAAPATEPPPAPAPLADVLADVLPTPTAGPGSGPAAPARSAMVQVAPSAGDTSLNLFAPATVTVAAGGTVTWTSDVRTPHDVNLGMDEAPDLAHTDGADALPSLPDGPWDGEEEIRSGFLSTDASAPGGTEVSVTFAEPGTYEYVCRFHPAMTGTVVVT